MRASLARGSSQKYASSVAIVITHPIVLFWRTRQNSTPRRLASTCGSSSAVSIGGKDNALDHVRKIFAHVMHFRYGRRESVARHGACRFRLRASEAFSIPVAPDYRRLSVTNASAICRARFTSSQIDRRCRDGRVPQVVPNRRRFHAGRENNYRLQIRCPAASLATAQRLSRWSAHPWRSLGARQGS